MTSNESERGFSAPPRRDRLKELRGVYDVSRLIVAAPFLGRVPRGDGRAVLVFPGFGANDVPLAPLRAYLRSIGHRPRGWGLGVNNADFDRLGRGSMELVERTARETGRPVDLVAWSLGGVFAREVGREMPSSVRRIITFGTPLHGPRHSATSRAFTDAETETIEAMIAERRRRPVRVPIVAVHSRNDGIVDWRACIDHDSPNVENVEVSSAHLTMGLDPDLWRLVAKRLAPSNV